MSARLLRAFAAELVAVPYRIRLKRLGKRPRLFPPLKIRGAGWIELGDDVRIDSLACLAAGAGGTLKIGSGFEMGSFARIDADTGSITIGEKSSVNSFCLLNGYGGLYVGSGVRIASHTVILSSTHNFDDPSAPIETQGVTAKRTVIADDVWLGAHCVVVGGVEIGSHSVVGAGSVVVGDIPPYSVAVGAPARVIRQRNSTDRYNDTR